VNGSGFALVTRPGSEVGRLLDLVVFSAIVPVYPSSDEAIGALVPDLR
jgi:hypothetical protein